MFSNKDWFRRVPVILYSDLSAFSFCTIVAIRLKSSCLGNYDGGYSKLLDFLFDPFVEIQLKWTGLIEILHSFRCNQPNQHNFSIPPSSIYKLVTRHGESIGVVD
jgi:hypothetical protein